MVRFAVSRNVRITSAGVFAGANKLIQLTTTRSLIPASAVVGTSGSLLSRLSRMMASGLTFPASMLRN